MRLRALFKSVAAGTFVVWKFDAWKPKSVAVCGITLVSFAAGSLVAANVANLNQARADSNRVFELRIYHAVPGKLPALQSRFRDTTTQLLAKHDLKVVGYWVADDSPASDQTLSNTFVFLVAHSTREEAKKNWDAVWVDPGFQEMVKSEKAEKLVEKVDGTYMRPTDFSPMK
jgi:negative regulator of sigma E activity